MKRLKKRQRKVLAAALIMSVLFVAGIPAIVLGAINKIWAVMILGIICVVAGFYGMPLVWVSYGSGFSLLRVVELVERDNVYTVEEIARQVNSSEKEVLRKIRKALDKRYIEGFLLVDDSRLKLNENIRQQRARAAAKCPNCGAAVEIAEVDANCPYCGTLVLRKSTEEGKKAEKEKNT